MSTEFRAVDGKELSILHTYYALGKTYLYSYTLTFTKISAGQTQIDAAVKLHASQMSFIIREEENPPVENYLRKKLFEKISERLKTKS